MKDDIINQMFRYLEANGISITKKFKDDILNLVDTEVDKFVEVFSGDMMIANLDKYNRFEKLSLTLSQKTKLDNNILYRYEYRRSKKNIKCMFVLKNCNNKLLLTAFSEDGNKKKGNDSYDFNIEQAVRIYDKVKKDWKGEF